MKNLCKSHVTALIKVRNQLAYRQTMNYTTLLLGEKNIETIDEAKNLINQAISKLLSIH
jgi:hypothetical protein